MSETVCLEIPDDILHATRMTPKEIKRELAILLFEQGKLSFGKARELAQLSAWDFQSLLAFRDIPLHYDVEEYEEDLDTLKELGRF